MRIITFILLTMISTGLFASAPVKKDSIALPVDVVVRNLSMSFNQGDSTLEIKFLIKPGFEKIDPEEFIKLTPVVEDYKGQEHFFGSIMYEGVNKEMVRKRSMVHHRIAVEKVLTTTDVYNRRGIEYSFYEHLPVKEWNTGVKLSLEILYIKGTDVVYNKRFGLANMTSVIGGQAALSIGSIGNSQVTTNITSGKKQEQLLKAIFNFKKGSFKINLRDSLNTNALAAVDVYKAYLRNINKATLNRCHLFVLSGKINTLYTPQQHIKDVERLLKTCKYTAQEYTKVIINKGLLNTLQSVNNIEVVGIWFKKINNEIESLYKQHKYDLGIAKLKQEAATAKLYNRIGVFYFAKGDIKMAKEYFIKAKKEHNHNAELNLKAIANSY